MSVFERLVGHLSAALATPEVTAFARGLSLRVRFTVGDRVHDVAIGSLTALSDETSEIGISASADDWALVLADPAPPTYHSFSSIQLRNPLQNHRRPAGDRASPRLVRSDLRQSHTS